MFDFKNIFASKTVLATIVGGVFSLLAALGLITIDPEIQGAVVTVLFALAGLFRVQATQQLALNPEKAAARARAHRTNV